MLTMAEQAGCSSFAHKISRSAGRLVVAVLCTFIKYPNRMRLGIAPMHLY